MNNVETQEILEMREQLAMLNKCLDNQKIVNDSLIRGAMSGKLSAINHRALMLCAIVLIAIPYCFGLFRRLGMSIEFCFATSLLLVFSLVAMAFSHYRIHKNDILDGDLVTTYREVARLRNIYKRWHYVSIPILVLWFVWLEVEFYVLADDPTIMLVMTLSSLVGGAIGGVFGMRAHNRTLREAEAILKQIDELQA